MYFSTLPIRDSFLYKYNFLYKSLINLIEKTNKIKLIYGKN